jgi:hypothetical protein
MAPSAAVSSRRGAAVEEEGRRIGHTSGLAMITPRGDGRECPRRHQRREGIAGGALVDVDQVAGFDSALGRHNWRSRTIRIERNLVRGAITTPKSHQRRLVDLTPQLAAVLRLARRQRRIEFLKYGMPLPDPMFPGDEGRRQDDSNVRKVFRRIADEGGAPTPQPA